MTDTTATPTPEAPKPTEPPKPAEPEKPAQAETDWKAEARKWETRAKEYKPAADRLAEIEEASKTELQKANEAREAAEKALATKEAEALRLTIAAKHGIPSEHLNLLVGADESELETKALQIKSLTESKPAKGAIGPYVPPEGTGGTGAVSDPAQAFADFIKAQSGQ